jgi:hypothetical protein
MEQPITPPGTPFAATDMAELKAILLGMAAKINL